MLYCPHCKTVYNITDNIADIAVEQSGGDSNNTSDNELEPITYDLNKLDDIIIGILNKEKIANANKVDLNKLKKNTLFTSLSGLQKGYVENYIFDSQGKGKLKTTVPKKPILNYLICYNCGFYEEIPPKTVFYSQSILNDTNIVDEDYSYMKYDKTLPVTNNYKCPNSNCPTNKNKVNGKAKFFRQSTHSHQLIYICCICDKYWKN